MNIFLITFQSVFMLLFIGVIGYFIVYRKLILPEVITVFSILGLEISLPAMIFADIMRKFEIGVQTEWFKLPLWWLGFSLFALFLTLIFRNISKKIFRSEFAISLFFQNGIFFPLAILGSLFGMTSPILLDLFFFTMFYAALLFNTYFLFFKNSKRTFDIKKIFHPVLLATIIALIFKFSKIDRFVPASIVSAFAMVGSMSIPLLMMILGGNIYMDFKNKKEFHYFEVAKFVIIKNVVFPLLALCILYYIRPERNIALILILQSAVPPITATPILVERAGGNREISNQFLLASFIASLATIPASLFLFGKIYMF